jgi:glycosyltransferase involved in cell wall biosynthesis
MATDFYAPVIGGLELGVATLAEELARRGHEVHVVTQAHPTAPSLESRQDVIVHRLPSLATKARRMFADPNKPFVGTWADPLLTRGIAALMDDVRPDVVHSHSWIMYTALAAARRRDVLRVHTAHDYSLMCPRKTLTTSSGPCPGRGPLACIRCSSEQYGTPRAVAVSGGLTLSRRRHHELDALCVISSTVAEQTAADDSLTGVPIHYTPECVPIAVADDPDIPAPAWIPDEPFALFVGALGPHKGLDVLLAARRLLDTRIPLVVAGTPRHDTPDMSGEADLVELHDAPNREILGAWRAARIGVVPSVWPEPLGLVSVEAQLSGAAVIASASGGLRDVVQHEENGLRVPPGDVRALSEAMARLWDDDDLRHRVSARGKETARAFTAPRVVDRLLKIYAGDAVPWDRKSEITSS